MGFNMKGFSGFGNSPLKQKDIESDLEKQAKAAGTRVITKADTPEGIKKMGLEIITDKDLEIQDKFEALPQSKEKDIVAKYLRGSKLTKKEEAIMDQYAKDNPPK